MTAYTETIRDWILDPHGPIRGNRRANALAALGRVEEREAALTEALRECVPYVNTAIHSDQPWRSETAQGVMARVNAALADSVAAGSGEERE